VDVLDLGDTRYPPALNLLARTTGEGDAHAQAICGIFARLFSRFWGPRTEDILRSALTTLLCGRDPAGPAPTLADVLVLLSDPGERARYRAGDPVALDVYWRQRRDCATGRTVGQLGPRERKGVPGSQAAAHGARSAPTHAVALDPGRGLPAVSQRACDAAVVQLTDAAPKVSDAVPTSQ
jgi:hypothetical protein